MALQSLLFLSCWCECCRIFKHIHVSGVFPKGCAQMHNTHEENERQRQRGLELWCRHTSTNQQPVFTEPVHHPCLPVIAHQPVVKNSPALTEDTEKKPSRSSSTVADKPGLAILLLLLARLHILRGPFMTSLLTGGGAPSIPVVRTGEGTCCAGDVAHLNLDAAAAEAQQQPEEEEDE